jgi:DNA mismatch repair ATPase MutS
VKVFLLHRGEDAQVKPELQDALFDALRSGEPFAVPNARRNLEREGKQAGPTGLDAELARDLELETLWQAMAAGDDFLYETAKRVTLSSLADPEAIRYRQRVLADCLEHADVVRQLYALAMEALEHERRVGGVWAGAGPERILSRSVQVLRLHVDVLKRLRQLAEEHAERFRSEGFRRFFATIREELADDYVQTVERHLRELELKRGVLISAELGKGNKGRGYAVRLPHDRSWAARLRPAGRAPSYGFTIPPRDEAGFKALEDLRGKGLNTIANAVAQSADHVQSFFAMLRLELAFYLGCLNLKARLDEQGEPVCFPAPAPVGELAFACEGLYDVCLSLHLGGRVVGNDVDADGKALVLVTGANQGGKSTFLRSVGLAQLMLQAGMFVGAASLRAGVCTGLFTHFKREEDPGMEGGKLDEELRRMSAVAERIGPGAMLLCNESFASTNEREGSEIARQVVRALLDNRVKVFYVTHLYDLAQSLHEQRLETVLFLRAERKEDGTRTFRVLPGEPLPTSYGADSYRRLFGVAEDAALAGRSS